MSETESSAAPRVNDSILRTIKKMLGLDLDYDAFDTDIIVFMNSAFMTLQQLGIGPNRGFVVTGVSEQWSDFIPEDTMLEGVKSYIFLCVRMLFDPPTSSFVLDAMKTQKEELEWRLREQAEFYPGDGSRKGYWQAQDEAESATSESGSGVRGYSVAGSDGAFRGHGGRYASDPDFPWEDGPAQPAITESEGDG